MKRIACILFGITLLVSSLEGEDSTPLPESKVKEQTTSSAILTDTRLKARLKCIRGIAKDIATIRQQFSELHEFSSPKKFSIPDLRYRYKASGNPSKGAKGSVVPHYVVQSGGCDIAISLYGPSEVGWQGFPFGSKITSYMQKLPDGTQVCVLLATPNDKLRERLAKIVADHIKRDF
jgi:hypothetical protein